MTKKTTAKNLPVVSTGQGEYRQDWPADAEASQNLSIAKAASERANMTPTERIKENEELVRVLAPAIKREHLANISGKAFMCVGGGIAIANAMGFTISVTEVIFNKELGCYQSMAHMHNGITGDQVAFAAGHVGDDEDRWINGPKFALLSMTQTRAIAKLLRANFGHLYVLLGASESTPAEEMSSIGTRGEQPRRQATAAPPKDDVNRDVKPKQAGNDLYTPTACDVFKEGTNKNGSWTLWKISTAEGHDFKTFSDSVAEAAEVAMEQGCQVAINFTENNYGRDVVDIQVCSEPIEEVEVIDDELPI